MGKIIPAKAWFFLLLTSTIWGGAYFLMSKGLEVFSAIQVASLRMSIAFFIFIPVFLSKLKDIPWKKLHFILVVGLLGSALPSLLFALAQTRLTSSITGVLASTTPLFTLLVGMTFFSVPFFRNRLIGVVVGLIGTLCIVLFGKEDVIGSELIFVFLPTLATICYAFSTNTVKSKLQDVSPLTLSASSFMLIGPPMLFVLVQSGFVNVMQTEAYAWNAFGYVALLSVSATVFCSTVYFSLVQMTSPVFSSTVAYIIPLVATVIGALKGEAITGVHIGGLVLILCGVYLSRR